MPVTIQIPRNV